VYGFGHYKQVETRRGGGKHESVPARQADRQTDRGFFFLQFGRKRRRRRRWRRGNVSNLISDESEIDKLPSKTRARMRRAELA
jgi:hypothetical protein